MDNYSKIKEFLDNVKDNFLLDISIKDFCGFVSNDPKLDRILRPYLAHTNPYCLLVKSTHEGYVRCIKQKEKLFKKCQDLKTFIGYCPAGVGELVVPIAKDNYCIGSINVAQFSYDPSKAIELVKKTFSEQGKTATEVGLETYNKFIRDSSINASYLKINLEILSALLGAMAVVDVNNYLKLDNTNSIDTIIFKQVESYIDTHYSEKITADFLALKLNTTSKNISLAIENIKNLSLINYLNYVRIYKSTTFLLNDNLPIENISMLVGFNDVSYYKKVFLSIMKITPKEFIDYYKNENIVAKIPT